MTKPKTQVQKKRDKMARLNNRLVKVIGQSSLDIPEIYMVLDNIKHSMLSSLRKVTGQE